MIILLFGKSDFILQWIDAMQSEHWKCLNQSLSLLVWTFDSPKQNDVCECDYNIIQIVYLTTA